MEKSKYAFLLMGSEFTPEKQQAHFETEKRHTYIFTIQNFEQAKEKVLELQKEGFGALELCGAFGETRCRELIEMTENKIAIGYSVHLPFQDSLFNAFFSG